MAVGESANKPTILLRDHDAKFVREFDAVFAAEGARVQAAGLESGYPNRVQFLLRG